MDHLHQLTLIMEGLEEAGRGGRRAIVRYWHDEIINQPHVLKFLVDTDELPKFFAKTREYILPKDEKPSHTKSSKYYWQAAASEAIFCKLNGNGSIQPMREEERHEQIMAKLVKAIAQAIPEGVSDD